MWGESDGLRRGLVKCSLALEKFGVKSWIFLIAIARFEINSPVRPFRAEFSKVVVKLNRMFLKRSEKWDRV